jgi:hypothetical protein
MKKYIIQHWRGQQSLFRSCLLNGVVGYLVLSIILSVAVVVVTGDPTGMLTGRGIPNITNTVGQLYILPFLMPFEIWALVGIWRCGLRNMQDRSAKLKQRLGGMLALGLATLIFASHGRAYIGATWDLFHHTK